MKPINSVSVIESGLPNSEIIAVREGIKPVLRSLVPPSKAFIEKSRWTSHGLYVVTSHLTVDGQIPMYASRELSLAKKAQACENELFKLNARGESTADLTNKLGELLGYPDCCINFFIENSQKSNKERIELALRKTRNGAAPLINNLHQNRHYSFYSFIQHFVCSYRCKHSIDLASKTFDSLKEIDSDKAVNIKDMLSKPVLFFDTERSIIIDGKKKEDSILYSTVFTPLNFSMQSDEHKVAVKNYNSLFCKFKEGDTLTMQPDRLVILKNGEIKHTINTSKTQNYLLFEFDN